MNRYKFFIVLYGPTGVGKTALSDELAAVFPIEIINMDSGQMYTSLTRGTAKPLLEQQHTPHHLFDIIDTPTHYCVMKYRCQVISLMHDIWQRQAIPVLVGGSGFYLKSLFFPPEANIAPQNEVLLDVHEGEEVSWWDMLHAIDPDRAVAIHRNDIYRIRRALAIWKQTGKKPSTYKPIFTCLAPSIIVSVERDRNELYSRIDQRTILMLQAGWIDEVRSLDENIWYDFIRHKKIIGYDVIIDYLAGMYTYQKLIELIQQKTRNYAKRQITFWHGFKKHLDAHSAFNFAPFVMPINLTLYRSDLYIRQLTNIIMKQIL